jgi:hypothetical protein
MTRKRPLLLAVALAIALSLTGCGSVFTRVDPAAVVVRKSMEVDAGEAWNRFTPNGGSHREVWTQHGVALDTLTYFAGVADGDPLDDLAPRDRKPPAFRASMSAEDVVALTETMLAGNGGRFELLTLEPAEVSGAEGFRFGFHYIARSEEVERSGIATGAIVDRRLYLMLFAAPRGHYYDRGAAEAIRLMDSLRILPAASR